MANRSRRYLTSREMVDREREYPLEEALNMLKTMEHPRFEETVECAVQLGIEARQSDQQVRGTITLPHGTGKTRTVAVFAEGPPAEEAAEAGADYVGADELIERVENGFMDFDIALATPDMMSRIGRLGRFLGPRGLMPSPKSGTVREDIGQAVSEFKAGKIEFRNDAGGNVHVPVGKVSFSTQDLADNVRALIDELLRLKPPAARGRFLRGVHVSTTMNPSVKVDIAEAFSRS
ncbi:MAG: 50S ribosomal protein L1 [Planctomycetota bacterium]